MRKKIAPEVYEWAAKFLWYDQPDELVADKDKLLAFAMARTPEEALTPLREHYTQKDFVEALRNAPPGLFLVEQDWKHWNESLGLNPPLPFPQKAILAEFV